MLLRFFFPGCLLSLSMSFNLACSSHRRLIPLDNSILSDLINKRSSLAIYFLEIHIIFPRQSDRSSTGLDFLLQPNDTESASNYSATTQHHDYTDPSHFLATQHLLVRQCRNMLRRLVVRTMRVWQDRASSCPFPAKPRGFELQLLQCFVHDHVLCDHILGPWPSAMAAA